MRSKLALTLLAAAATCSCSSTSTGTSGSTQPAVTETCAFRVDGSTVDKVNANDHVASMNGSTLGITCSNVSGSSASAVLTASIRAFDGPGEYVLDSTKTRGEISYRGNDGASYGLSEGDGLKPKCTFVFSEGPKEPKPGDVVSATFTCEKLRGFKVGGGVGAPARSVEVTEGALKFIVAE